MLELRSKRRPGCCPTSVFWPRMHGASMGSYLPKDLGEAHTIPVRARPAPVSDAPKEADPPDPAPVETEPAEVAISVEVPEVVAVEPCPKCGERLVNPATFGWCLKCGYCRATEEMRQTVSKTTRTNLPKLQTRVDVAPVLKSVRKLSFWFWLWLWGKSAVIFLALGGHMLTQDGTRGRAVWCTAQIALGLVFMIGGQLWAVCLVAPMDDKLGIRDIFIPFRLWSAAVRRLPMTWLPICACSWGLTSLLTGFTIVGGLEYWLPKKAPNKAQATRAPISLVQLQLLDRNEERRTENGE